MIPEKGVPFTFFKHKFVKPVTKSKEKKLTPTTKSS